MLSLQAGMEGVQLVAVLFLIFLSGVDSKHAAETLDYSVSPLDEENNSFLVKMSIGKTVIHNLVVTEDMGHGIETRNLTNNALICCDVMGESFFAVQADTLTLSTGFMRSQDGTINAFYCDEKTCTKSSASDVYDPMKVNSAIIPPEQLNQAKKPKEISSRNKRDTYKFHQVAPGKKQIHRVAVQVGVDLDALETFSNMMGANVKDRCWRFRLSIQTGRFSTKEQACQDLYDYFSLYMAFVSRIFDTINHPDFEIQIYLSDVLIAYNRSLASGSVDLYPIVKQSVNKDGVLNMRAAEVMVKGWRAVQSIQDGNYLWNSAATILITNYTDPGHLGDSVTRSVCDSWNAVGIVTDRFQYASVGVFAHALAHIMGASHMPRGGLMTDEHD